MTDYHFLPSNSPVPSAQNDEQEERKVRASGHATPPHNRDYYRPDVLDMLLRNEEREPDYY